MNRRIILCLCAAGFLAAVSWKVSEFCNSHRRWDTTFRRFATASTQTEVKNTLPSDADIFHCRLFPEPLVPIGGKTTPQENLALMVAIEAHKNRIDQDDHSAILSFLERFPNSPWRAALLTNLGLEYRHTGWFLKALDAWEQAWIAGKDEKSIMGKPLIDRAVGELAELNARLGRRERVEQILKEIEGRPLIGPATEKITAAREGVWMMHNEPGNAFKCGPFALDRIRASQRPSTAPDPKILAAQSTNRGMSLDQVWKLSGDLGMNYQIAKRAPGSRVVIPSVVNWKANHYAALLREEHGRYVLEDPTFGDPILVSKAALDAESTGYFLIPNGNLPEGWKRIGVEEAKQVWGMGNTGDHDASGTKGIDDKAKPDCPKAGMASYNFHTQAVSLNIMDTPVGYTPPRGPDMHFTITYNQRELSPTINHSHSNFGSKWVCNWIGWVDGDPTIPPTNATRIYLPSGGSELHTVYSGTFSTDPQSGATLTVFPDPTVGRFERNLPDGSKLVFELRDYIPFSGSNSVYLTKWIDPAGNTTRFNYDSNFRLTSVTDALNQTTTITHLSNDPAVLPDFYLISQIADPFGRLATFDYQSGQLIRIHDMIGIVSQFGYATGTDFINTMTTPYGTTIFSQPVSSLDASTPPSGNARVIQAVDPTGAVERVEYGHQAPGISATQTDVPSGLGITNDYYQYRNSFYWDKKATAMYPPDQNGTYDFTKAKLIQWLHTSDAGSASNIKEREKMPLENAVYYLYAGQQPSNFVGNNGFPTKIARKLDDGTTQLWQYEYNGVGKMTKSTDPIGRVVSYDYDTNNIDLLKVRQTTGTNNETLRTLTYNSQHKPLTDKDAAGEITNYGYNSYGQLTSVQNAKNETTTYGYGDGTTAPTGDLASITSPPFNGSSAVTTFTYDSANRVHSVTTSPDNYTVATDYDNLDRPTQITYPDTTTQQFQYTQDFGQGLTTILDLTKNKDRRGNWTTRHYNANRQMDSITDPLNRTTQFGWCSCGSLTSITDARGKLTTFNRDLQSRVSSKVFADTKQILYAYENTTSRLKSMTDSKNQTTNYQYFADNDLKQASYTNAQIATPTVNFTYDPNYNRVLTMADGTGTTTYAYKPITGSVSLGAGQLQTVDGPLTNDTITYTYDELGRALSEGVNGISASRAYDSLGRTGSVTNPLGLFTNTFDSVTPRLQSTAFPNGQVTTHSYSTNTGDRRLQTIQNNTSGGVILSKFDYVYDPEGEITQLTRKLGPTGFPKLWFGPSGSMNDAGDQLTNLTEQQSTDVYAAFSWGYDNAGNRTSDNGGTYTFNDVNQLTVAGYSYDANGNLSATPTKTYEWDAANRLTAINYTSTNTRTEFTYDGLGRRVKIVERNITTPAIDYTFQPTNTHWLDYSAPGSYVLTAGSYAFTLTGTNPNGGDNTALVDGIKLFLGSTDTLANKSFEAPILASGTFQYRPSTANVKWSFTNLSGISTNNSSMASSNPPTPGGVQVGFVQQASSISQTVTLVAGTYSFTMKAAQRAIVNPTYQVLHATLMPTLVVTSTKQFIWVGNRIAEERDANNNVLRRFYPQGEQISGTSYYYTRDHLGSVRELVDSANAIRAQYDYDAWGNRTKLNGDLDSEFGYTGHYFHQQSGLNLALFRAYDSMTGRWLSRDPIGERGGPNLYGYVGNDPLNLIDPLGLWQVTIGGGYGYAALITFGHNNGQWNASAIVGVGIGGTLGFNPNDNTQGHLSGDAVHLGVAARAAVGVPDLLEATGGFSVTGEANKCGDYWWGTTVDGELGDVFLGNVSGSAWFGGTGNVEQGTMHPSIGASGNKWGWSISGLAIVGGTAGLTW
jgi:RHS repeat-associated protein